MVEESSANSTGGQPDYEKLYYAAFNRLTDIGRLTAKAQQELERMYLEQTEPNTP